MKIALYVYSWPAGSSANGIVTYAAQLVPALRELGHEVFVLTSDTGTSGTDDYTIDLSAIRLPRSVWSRIKSLLCRSDTFEETLGLAVRTLTQKHNVDILEIEESFGWSLKIAHDRNIPVVVRLHGPWFLNGSFDHSDSAGYRRRVEREGRAIAGATLVTAPSVNVLENVRTQYNLKLELARVIPNPFGVDGDAAPWKLSGCSPNRILYVGRFDRRKGGDLVLRAFAGLAELYPNLRLSFIGPDDGVYEDGARLSFDEFARKNLTASCRSRVDFHGKLSHENVMAMRSDHFFTIIASQFEILPYAVIEAMALGCPIVASNVGGIPELITDQKNGLLFRNQDLNELILACRRLLDNHARASCLGAQARKDCLELFNPGQVAAQTISAYHAAIDAFNQNLEPTGRLE